jgi:hypothetical protein
MNNPRATLSAPAAGGARALLRQAVGSVDVDVVTGIIRNAAVMTIGPASGWPFEIDRVTLSQFEAAINTSGGIPSRFKHQGMNPDGTPMENMPETLGTKVAMLRNARIDGDVLRADVYVGTYAEHVPGEGNVRAYLLNLAKEAPTELGLSADFTYTIDNSSGRPAARLANLTSIDFVDKPAANRRGLLGDVPTKTDTGTSPAVDPRSSSKGIHMDPELLKLLVSMGLDPNATPEQAIAFLTNLKDDQKQAVMSKFPTAIPAPAQAAAQTPAAPAAPAPAAMAARAVPAHGEDPQRAVFATEAARVNGIKEVAKLYDLDDAWARAQMAAGADVPTAQRAALAKMQDDYSPMRVHVREDQNMATLGDAIRDSIHLRAGLSVKNPSERAREFRGLTLVETARAYLQAVGIDTKGMGRNEVAQLVFNRGRMAAMGRAALAHTPGDFSNILADTIGKTLRQAYDEYPTTYQTWARRATAPDFKTISRTQLSESPSLRRVRKGGEYPDVSLSDSKETYVLQKYGNIITLAWETLINDDLNAFSRTPQIQGRAAKRLENELVYFVLLANATMSDTGALFNTTAQTAAGGHANLASANAAITVAALNIAVGQMMVQRGPKGSVLGVTPEFLVVPPSISGTAWEAINSTSNPSSSNANVKNRFAAQGGQFPLTSVVEPLLQTGVTLFDEDGVAVGTANGSTTAWFLAASNSMIDTVEISFLEEEQAPVMTEQDGFRVDGRQYKIRHTCAAAAIDYRGLFKNNGA